MKGVCITFATAAEDIKVGDAVAVRCDLETGRITVGLVRSGDAAPVKEEHERHESKDAKA